MTEFLIRGRATGKSYDLIQMMANDDTLVCITHSQQSANQLFMMAAAQGYEIEKDRFIIPSQVDRQKGAPAAYVVDNIELVLTAWLGAEVQAITGTGIINSGSLAPDFSQQPTMAPRFAEDDPVKEGWVDTSTQSDPEPGVVYPTRGG